MSSFQVILLQSVGGVLLRESAGWSELSVMGCEEVGAGWWQCGMVGDFRQVGFVCG